MDRLTAEAIARLEELIKESGTADVSGVRGFFAELKADPGRLGLETLLEEIAKLSRVREIGLPADLARCSRTCPQPQTGLLFLVSAARERAGARSCHGFR